MELGSGSIRIHNRDTQSRIFRMLGMPAAIAAFRTPAFIVREGTTGVVGVGIGGSFQAQPGGGYPCLGVLPALTQNGW